MIKMRAPEGVSISHEGRPVEPDKDGAVHVHPRDLDTFTAHGYVPWNAPAAALPDVDAMSKSQLIEAMIACGRAELEAMDAEQLRAGLRRYRSQGEEAEDATEPTAAEIAEARDAIDRNGVTEEHIRAMNRRELFAYLKANKVSSPPPVSNEELRIRALDTLRKQAA